MSDRIRLNVTIPDDLHREIKSVAALAGETLEAVVERAVRRLVDEKKGKAK